MRASRIPRLAVPVVLALGACSGSEDAGPTPTTRPSTSTTVVDRSGVALPGVGGVTTTTIDERGTAVLAGVVTGPTGPVAGATVRVERLVAGQSIRRDVRAGPDGRWELAAVPGGRYRLRAFLAPAYAQRDAVVRFLPDGEAHRVDLTVEDHRGVTVRADVAPDEPVAGAPVNLVVLVVRRMVDGDGVVRSVPAAGTVVDLVGLGRWSAVAGPAGADDDVARARLDDAGRARFELRCEAPGPPGLRLRVPVVVAPAPAPASTATTAPLITTEEVPLEVPTCTAPAGSPDGEATTSTSAP